ncbi:putative peptidoglycan lipid II flippase [Clostridium tetanomorphum]|uniref:Probable lipid II flippase MurJ n=1 Tax=Clostridium tetanomorphum TaxID=1553 RepID=A0A923EAN8_CLOTT|nr:murein biosynthesis integral membrane protein MurJ [Clostridium tetanomorphum]KAJ49431.1 virulence factor mviN [Clostridium tetanomorphum DSM 665]KAJ52310.1 virulence factor mviN [Clostridium tetanomorphum DSM 665]MBC2399555.1 murein biosynthesis integral membrane protein MurJ [Clostridium tetanomorphum]MBP1866305.1 putative peptidoglycan lipid II flippase [Clostridium tetanomorphum]NRS85796.1 putative peptidoglycan lipid II flippase [Clostridium tetanomorphum]
MSKNKFLKSSLIVMLIIIMGKILAIIRDSLVAAKFGATYTADIYNFSIGIVYLLTTISYGLTTTFIPLNTDHIEKYTWEKRNSFVNNIISTYSIFTIIITIILILFSKQIVIIFGSGFSSNIQIFNTSVTVIRIMLVSLIFVSIQSVITGVLQSHNEFYEPAAMSMVSNIIFIVYLIFFTDSYGIYGFAVATVIGFFAQFIINVPKYKKLGYNYKIQFNLRDEELKKMLALMMPVIISTSLIQLNNFINRAFAVNIFEGAVTALDLSNKLNTLAYEVFAIGIAMVIYPTLSKYASDNNTKEYKEALLKGINVIFLIMIPASFAIGVLRIPLITILFKRGAFDERAVNLTANALLFYSPAMIAYGLRDVLNKAFYAIKDTKTPMINSFLGIIINIIINIFIVKYMQVSGLTLATSISAIITTILMLISLNKKLKGIGLKNVFLSFNKILIASVSMGGIVFFINEKCLRIFGMNMKGSIISLGTSFIIGSLIYFIIIYFLKVKEFTYFIDLIREKIKRK